MESLVSSNKWLVESLSSHQVNMVSITKHFFTGKSAFQTVDVVELGPWGRTLILDDKIQSTEFDEAVYHETLVHPAMMLHPNPKAVFIGGGGEGATLREVLRHKSVEKCVMVDIDGDCVDMCKEHLPQHHGGAFEDPRTELIIDDAKKQLEEYPGTFDVIICDLADPLEEGPCYLLYTQGWYELLKSKLSPGGIIVSQTGPGGIHAVSSVGTPVCNTVAQVFKHTHPYITHIPSFSDLYSFVIGSDEHDLLQLTPDEVDKRIAERLGGFELQHYDGLTHVNMTTLSKVHRKLYAEDKRIVTPETPVFMP